MMAALKNKRFLVFGAAAVVCFLFLVGGLMVNARQAVVLLGQRNSLEQQRTELRTAVQGVDLQKLRDENAALAGELSDIERALPEAEYMPTLIRQMESTAALTGNDIIELRPGEIRRGLSLAKEGAASGSEEGKEGSAETKPEGGEGKKAAAGGTAAAGGNQAGAEEDEGGQRYDEMDIELRFDGSYAGAFEFIKQLGKLGKIISVDIVEIERAGPTEVRPDGRAAATVRLQTKAYILAPRTGFPGELTIKVY
jgi:Tfp pilus assembly protein PilO